MKRKLTPLNELSPVARESILRGLKLNWKFMTTFDKIRYIRARGMEFCVAAEIPQNELDALEQLISTLDPVPDETDE